MENKNEKILNFNPNDIGNINNNIFGLPFNSFDADVIILPVPWDVTTSYKPGTSKAPKGIFDASFQIDVYLVLLPKEGNPTLHEYIDNAEPHPLQSILRHLNLHILAALKKNLEADKSLNAQ